MAYVVFQFGYRFLYAAAIPGGALHDLPQIVCGHKKRPQATMPIAAGALFSV